MDEIKELHIASLIILVRPENFEEILKLADSLPRAECQHDANCNKLIVVFEASSEMELSDILDSINNWQGVLSAQLAYHHCEPAESLLEEISHVSHTS